TDEERVQQMQHGVLVSTDVAAHRKPLRGSSRVERPVVELSRRIAQVVPGRIEERVGDVGLAPSLPAALWTLHEVPLFVPRERAHSRVVGPKVLDERELDGKIL